MSDPLNILVVEDSADDAALVAHELEKAGFVIRMTRVETEADYRLHLASHIDIVLSDFNLPRFSSPRALSLLKEFRLEIPLVVVSGTIGEERAVEMVKAGATDYVLKDHLVRLPSVVRRALAESKERVGRRRAEQQLQIHRRAIEAAANGILITDRFGTVLSANPAFCAMTGYPPGEIIGGNTRVLKSGEHGDAFFRKMWATIEAGEIWQGQLVNRRKDGSTYREEMTITPVRMTGGDISHYIAVKQDVTERCKLEEHVRQVQKMESIGLLAGGVAHDFNNLLTVIQGHASMLRAEAGLRDELRDSANEISLAAERASRLTRQLLAFSREQVFQPQLLDVGEVLGAMTRMLRRLIDDNISLELDIEPGLRGIHADQGMMDQLLMNLTVNARDAMPSGGRLVIRASNQMIDESHRKQHPRATAGDYVCLTVTDSGCGMTPEVQERIFEPFFTTKSPGKGTGLGLGTVYGIVRQHKGWIEVSSEVGQGSTFRIYLPAVESPAGPAKSPASENGLRGRNETVLVVEDESALRNLVRNVLERFGFNVIDAKTGVAASDIWRERNREIDLLVTDIVMPDHLSGLELARRLRKEREDLPVIFTSGYSFEVVSKGLELHEGMNFLQKPYPVQQLITTVRAALDRVRTGH